MTPLYHVREYTIKVDDRAAVDGVGDFRVVTIEPIQLSISVEKDETIMAAAIRHGYKWPNTCRGRAQCGLCAFGVDSEDDPRLGAISSKERYRLDHLYRLGSARGGDRRLACQATVNGAITITKRGVQPADVDQDERPSSS